jgi:hypothetical protein
MHTKFHEKWYRPRRILRIFLSNFRVSNVGITNIRDLRGTLRRAQMP